MDQTSKPAPQAHETKADCQESSGKEGSLRPQPNQADMAVSSENDRSAEVLEHERRAAVILDGMYQFVGLLDSKGNILEINRSALEGAGVRIEEIRGTPFWTARWWQVSEELQELIRGGIRRAAAGEFVRYE